MKLWKLSVAKLSGAERQYNMLRDFARELRAPGTEIVMGENKHTAVAFIALGNRVTPDELLEVWRAEYGDPVRTVDTPFLGSRVMNRHENLFDIAAIYDMDKRQLQKLADQCFYPHMVDEAPKGDNEPEADGELKQKLKEIAADLTQKLKELTDLIG